MQFVYRANEKVFLMATDSAAEDKFPSMCLFFRPKTLTKGVATRNNVAITRRMLPRD
jgi:hypothetical protein